MSLEPCPLCKGKASFGYTHHTGMDSIHCETCGLELKMSQYSNNNGELAAKWNMRPERRPSCCGCDARHV